MLERALITGASGMVGNSITFGIKPSSSEIDVTNPIKINKYHKYVSEEQHKQLLNSMPYKKNNSPELRQFCEYLEEFMSDQLKEQVKIFNDDIWVRICRPNVVSIDDFNPCHRDVYLDFYRKLVNIYIPIVGSNVKSSLFVQEGSHLWSENVTAITTGGAFFKNINKKFSVDAIVQSKIELNMIRPNPSTNEVMIFSPYLHLWTLKTPIFVIQYK